MRLPFQRTLTPVIEFHGNASRFGQTPAGVDWLACDCDFGGYFAFRQSRSDRARQSLLHGGGGQHASIVA